MKTRNHFIVMAIVAIVTIAITIIGCKQDVSPPADSPRVQDTPRTLSFGSPACTVTIKSTDSFTTAEWTALCNKVVAAIERGYVASTDAAKTGAVTYFTNNIVSVVLSKSATFDVEVKDSVPRTIYFKANGSSIDGIPDTNLMTLLTVSRVNGSYHYPE
jgi:hypothetical protein